jgi:hypothetical protein
MKFKEAKRLSLLKWDFAIKNPQVNITENKGVKLMDKELPELEELTSHCGFCEYYGSCNRCPLCPEYEKDVWISPCCEEFYEYASSSSKQCRKTTAIKLYDKIKNCKEKSK